MRFRFSRRAEADLEAITAFIAEDDRARAITFVQAMREHCGELLQFPLARRLRPESGDGVRVSIFGNYLILYVAHAELLEIRRVVHGARDLTDIE